MAIKRDLSDLPPAGLAPDDSPRFISVLVDEWAESREDDKPTAQSSSTYQPPGLTSGHRRRNVLAEGSAK